MLSRNVSSRTYSASIKKVKQCYKFTLKKEQIQYPCNMSDRHKFRRDEAQATAEVSDMEQALRNGHDIPTYHWKNMHGRSMAGC